MRLTKMRLCFPIRCHSSKRRSLMMMMVVWSMAALLLLHRHFKRYEGISSHLLDDENRLVLKEVESITYTGTTGTMSTSKPEEQKHACVTPSNEDLHTNYNENMTSLTWKELVEKTLTSYQDVISLLNRTNDLLAEELRSESTAHENNTSPEKHYFDGDVLRIGSYDYIAGGRWRPSDCHAKWKVAIVIPFRDRHDNLAMLINNLIPFLQNQKLEFGFFVAEQQNDLVFNRGLMKNVGYREATRFGDWDCVIFHDTDLVPRNGENYYGCDNFPRHFAAYPEQFNYTLLYVGIFGGVAGLTAEQVRQSNGYSNAYWGWGGEDDELSSRLKRKGFRPSRETEYGFYRSLKHVSKTKSQLCSEVDCLYNNFAKRCDWEGINNMTYSMDSLEMFPLYTKISVDIQKEKWNSNMPPCQNMNKSK